MKRLLTILLLSACLAGCAKQVTVPSPPDITATVKSVAESGMSEAAKIALIQSIIAAAQQEYAALLARLENQGQNIKDVLLQILAAAASFASMAISVSK